MRNFIKLSKWFYKESKRFVGKPRQTIFGYIEWELATKEIVYYPIAYIKFMWLCYTKN